MLKYKTHDNNVVTFARIIFLKIRFYYFRLAVRIFIAKVVYNS